MSKLKSLFTIINYKTFIVTGLAVASTWLCKYYQLKADFPLTIVGIAIVFPVVFSINSAYQRRERTLILLSDLIAHAQALYLAFNHWFKLDEKLKTRLKNDLITLFERLKKYCTSDEHIEEKEIKLTKAIKDISVTIQEVRNLNVNPGEISRLNQYISKILISIENIKVIRKYRTPITLRSYSRIFIYSFPILYGPYFEYTAELYSHLLEYVMPILFSFILVSLSNIQEHLENPFDQIGEDDVKFNMEDFEKQLTAI